MKIICLLAPHLPVQVERRRDPDLDDQPLVVGGRPWDPGAVLDCCPDATAAGVRPGMRLSRAEALCPSARFLPADEAAYQAAHRTLDRVPRHFTGRVETAGLGLLFADGGGLERAVGSDARLVRHVAREAERASGLDVRVGLAGDRITAEQAARAAPGLLTRKVRFLLDQVDLAHPVVDLQLALYPLRPAHLGATQLALFTRPADARRRRLQEVIRRLRERREAISVLARRLVKLEPKRGER